MKKSKRLLCWGIFLFCMFIINPVASASNERWISPKEVTTPAAYGNREYTREHWTRFWVNPYGFHRGVVDADYIGAMYCSVFDQPGNLSNGYTAVTEQDIKKSFNRYGPGNYLEILNKFLVPYGIKQDDKTGDWLVSPASYKQGGDRSPFSWQSGCKYDVAITKSTSGPPIDPFSSPAKPEAIDQGPPHFKAGAYYGGKRYYWGSSGPYGEINLTQEAAESFFTVSQSTSANVIISFPYGISVSGLRYTSLGKKIGERDHWQAVITNYTPYIAKNVTLRAYKWEEDGTIEQVDSKVVDIGATGLKSTEIAHINYDFSVPLSDKSYKVIVTANLEIKEGSTKIDRNSTNPEPLNSEFAFGSAKGLKTPYDGDYEKAMPVSPIGHSGLGVYDDNWMASDEMTGGEGGSEGDGLIDATPENLSVTSIGLYDNSGKPVGGTLKAGRSYKVRVSYNSTFDFAGWAKLGCYFREKDGDVKRVGSETWYYFEPNGTFQKEYRWAASCYEGQIIATINLEWKGGEKFMPLLFEGEQESTYEDNKKQLGTAASESSRTPPTPGQSTQPLHYHPVTEELVPVYKTEKEKVWVDEWEKVPFRPAEYYIKPILIPDPNKE